MLRAGVLDDKRADFHRRKESLEKLEEQLAAYQALLEEEDREAKERLESARLAKAEFEEREGAEEDARAAELQTKKKQLVKELGEVDLQIVQHEDEGLETDELETKKSELEEAIVKVDTELRQMRERADRRAKLAEFNKGELEREKAAKAKKACVIGVLTWGGAFSRSRAAQAPGKVARRQEGRGTPAQGLVACALYPRRTY